MLLILTGHMRSGTTLLTKLCNGHPDMFVTKEFGNLLAVDRSFARYKVHVLMRVLRKKPWSRSFIRQSSKWMNNSLFVFRHLLFLRSRCGNDRVTAQDIEQAFLAMNPNVRVVGDKYPGYIFILPKLLQQNDIKPVVIVRDCRDVVSSTLKNVRTVWRGRDWVARWGSVDKVAKNWVRSAQIIEQCADSIFTLPYEKLVLEPREQLQSLGEFLGVDPDGFPVGQIHSTSIGKYRQGLTAEELSIVMEIAGPEMERFGYH